MIDYNFLAETRRLACPGQLVRTALHDRTRWRLWTDLALVVGFRLLCAGPTHRRKRLKHYSQRDPRNSRTSSIKQAMPTRTVPAIRFMSHVANDPGYCVCTLPAYRTALAAYHFDLHAVTVYTYLLT